MLIESATLRQWSGKKTRPALKQWLGRHGVKWLEDAEGWPITTEAAINQAIGVTGSTETPNLEAVRRRGNGKTTAQGAP